MRDLPDGLEKNLNFFCCRVKSVYASRSEQPELFVIVLVERRKIHERAEVWKCQEFFIAFAPVPAEYFVEFMGNAEISIAFFSIKNTVDHISFRRIDEWRYGCKGKAVEARVEAGNALVASYPGNVVVVGIHHAHVGIGG